MNPKLECSPHRLAGADVPCVLVLSDLIRIIRVKSGALRLDLRSITALGDVLAEILNSSCRGTYLNIDVGVILVTQVRVIRNKVSVRS